MKIGNNNRKVIRQIIIGANFDTIKHLFKHSSIVLDISSLNNFREINEIRQLNNCLKHSIGVVDLRLNQINPFWEIDKPITLDLVDARIKKFPKCIFDFFADLEEKIR